MNMRMRPESGDTHIDDGVGSMLHQQQEVCVSESLESLEYLKNKV